MYVIKRILVFFCRLKITTRWVHMNVHFYLAVSTDAIRSDKKKKLILSTNKHIGESNLKVQSSKISQGLKVVSIDRPAFKIERTIFSNFKVTCFLNCKKLVSAT